MKPMTDYGELGFKKRAQACSKLATNYGEAGLKEHKSVQSS